MRRPRKTTSRFGLALQSLRTSAGLTQEALAEELKFSRGYFSLLESQSDKDPSLSLLRDLCRRLILNRTDVPDLDKTKQMWDLLTAALDLDIPTDPFIDVLGSFKDELRLQQQRTTHEIWVVSTLLAENHLPGFLRQTAENLRDRVRYTFFVSQGDGVLEWEGCVNALRENEGLNFNELADGQLVAIACPRMLCLPSVRLLNPGKRDTQAVVTVGRDPDLMLYQLPISQVHSLFTNLHSIRSSVLENHAPVDADYSRLLPN